MKDDPTTPKTRTDHAGDAGVNAVLAHCAERELRVEHVVVLVRLATGELATVGYGFGSPAELIVGSTVHLQDTAEHHGLAVGLTIRADGIPRHEGGGWTI